MQPNKGTYNGLTVSMWAKELSHLITEGAFRNRIYQNKNNIEMVVNQLLEEGTKKATSSAKYHILGVSLKEITKVLNINYSSIAHRVVSGYSPNLETALRTPIKSIGHDKAIDPHERYRKLNKSKLRIELVNALKYLYGSY